MLCFLLDEHISQDVRAILEKLRPEIIAFAVTEWQDRRFEGLSDDEVLRAASASSLCLVTYDQRTIPPLLQRWAQRPEKHAGGIFVDERTIPPSDLAGLAQALVHFWLEHSLLDWTKSPSVPAPCTTIE